jgi:hypothetical protein
MSPIPRPSVSRTWARTTPGRFTCRPRGARGVPGSRPGRGRRGENSRAAGSARRPRSTYTAARATRRRLGRRRDGRSGPAPRARGHRVGRPYRRKWFESRTKRISSHPDLRTWDPSRSRKCCRSRSSATMSWRAFPRDITWSMAPSNCTSSFPGMMRPRARCPTAEVPDSPISHVTQQGICRVRTTALWRRRSPEKMGCLLLLA